jgi:hypothetical protein
VGSSPIASPTRPRRGAESISPTGGALPRTAGPRFSPIWGIGPHAFDLETGDAGCSSRRAWWFDSLLQWSPGNSHIVYHGGRPAAIGRDVETANPSRRVSPVDHARLVARWRASSTARTATDSSRSALRPRRASRAGSRPICGTMARPSGSDGGRIACRVETRCSRGLDDGRGERPLRAGSGSFPFRGPGGDSDLSNGAPLRLRPAGRFEPRT